MELSFIIFSLLQHISEKMMLIAHSAALESEHCVFRGLSNLTLFLMLTAYVICIVTYIEDKSRIVKLLTVTSLIGSCFTAVLFLLSIFSPEIRDMLYSMDIFGKKSTNVFYLMSGVVLYIAGFVIFLFIKYFNKISKPILFTVLLFILCPAVVLIMHFFGMDYNLIYPVTIVSFIFMFSFAYMWQVEQNREQQIIISNDRLFRLQNQIRPHFLFTTRSTRYTCSAKMTQRRHSQP